MQIAIGAATLHCAKTGASSKMRWPSRPSKLMQLAEDPEGPWDPEGLRDTWDAFDAPSRLVACRPWRASKRLFDKTTAFKWP